MEYAGEYILNIIDGKIVFPWQKKGDLSWIIYKCVDKDYEGISIIMLNKNEIDECIASIKTYYDRVEVVCRGDFSPSDKNVWEVPGDIVEHIKDNEIILQGMGTYIEIIAKETAEEYENFDVDILNKLQFGDNDE